MKALASWRPRWPTFAKRRPQWPRLAKQRPQFPLLVKDLTELAAQRRTYVLRFWYALGLFVVACTLIYANIGVSANAAESLGRGRNYFSGLIEFQLAALYIVVPMLTAGAITEEKQRGTLVLLLLTTLTPWQIVFQKFAGRMVPILSFVFLSFPLLAITYAFGGVTVDELAVAIAVQIFACLALGAFAILCSAFFRTTAQAVAATYLGCLFPAIQFAAYYGLFPAELSALYMSAMVLAGFSLFATVGCLSMAEAILGWRKSPRMRNVLSEIFGRMDRLLDSANAAVGRIVLVPERGPYPDADPIRWRETRVKGLGKFRYLVRLLLLIEVPALLAVQLIHQRGGDFAGALMGLVLTALWLGSIVLVIVQAASLLPEERARGTLNVLLAAPLQGRQILAEKASGVHRLTAIVAISVFTVSAFQFWWHWPFPWDCLILTALAVAIYFSTVEWLALAIGLRVRSQLQAIVVSQSIVAGWIAVWASILPLLRHFQIKPGQWSEVVLAFSPIDMIVAIQRSLPPLVESSGMNLAAPGFVSPWRAAPVATIVHFAFYLVLLILLQTHCQKNADRCLGRIPQPHRRRERSAHAESSVEGGGEAEPARQVSRRAAEGQRKMQIIKLCDLCGSA